MTIAVKRWNPALFAILILLTLAFLTGCNAPMGQLNAFNRYFKACDYENSALFAQKRISGREKPQGEDLLWALQLGTVERIRQDYRKSTEYFDKAEDMLKFYDEQSKI
ncbi:MAG TPA: hypothetical protein ENH43_00815, partial [Phycisphaerales bacterium]|nr:hypothetical protein [Phycisphaerales bacterium]